MSENIGRKKQGSERIGETNKRKNGRPANGKGPGKAGAAERASAGGKGPARPTDGGKGQQHPAIVRRESKGQGAADRGQDKSKPDAARRVGAGPDRAKEQRHPGAARGEGNRTGRSADGQVQRKPGAAQRVADPNRPNEGKGQRQQGPASSPGARPARMAGSPGAPARSTSGGAPRSKGIPVATDVSADELKIGDNILVTIKRIGINGEGVGYFKRKAVFVKGALPEEIVKARITSQQPTMMEAAVVHIEKASPYRKKPDCPVYESCGGCQLQHMSYEGQLKAKEDMVREAFERYAEGTTVPIRPIVGMEHPWAYRNKAQLQTGIKGRTVVTGLYSAGTHQLVDISGCPIHHPELNRVMGEVRSTIERLGIRIYNEKDKTGTIRTLVARVAATSGKIQLTLVTATDNLPLRDKLVHQIRGALPNVVTIAQNVNPGKTSLIFGDTTRILWGLEQLEETLGSVKLSLSPRAFFQLNPEQTVKLYDFVQEAAALTGTEQVVDAYCGTGTIGLWLAPHAQEVRGIESIKEAVADARRNAATSGLANARFFEGRAEALLPQWVREGLRPDVIVVDPPRTGCDPALLKAIADARPSRLVYVSCNPSTLAKDARILHDAGFRINWIQPVDMFPQTSQVECVVLLEWKG